MKEATGELNMTVVVVLAVAFFSIFFFSVLWPMIRGNFRYKHNCDEAICVCPGCGPGTRLVDCTLKDGTHIQCPWKG